AGPGGFSRIWGAAGGALAGVSGAALEGIGASVALAGDLDGDGSPEIATAGTSGDVVVFRLDGSVVFRLDADTLGSKASVALASGADVTGDGISDVVVGLPRGGYEGTGEVDVFSGRDGKLGLTLSAFDIGAGSSPTLMGRSVGLVPDVDGDGAAEILVGAPNAQAPRGRKFHGAVVVASLEN